jgi:nitrate reductase assembly molybdenum cofactor insertion protein NarJ/NAD-dependent dihydropyrimidine dehydrogenase PreA subunit
MNAGFSDVFHFLAEALSDPPDWLALPGCEWPLTAAAAAVIEANPAAWEGLAAAVKSLEEVKPASLEDRQRGYEAMLAVSGRSGLWMNEAGALSGRMLGDETWEVERWYRAAGLEIPGAELPDHASLELEFLAYLSADIGEDVLEVSNAFLEQHAGRWLPQLGGRLVKSGDPVYAPIGGMLRSVLKLASVHEARPQAASYPQRPKVSPACTLCMACISACPREVLRIKESPEFTRLVLLAADCDGCGQCAERCEFGALQMMETSAPPAKGWQILFESPRDTCMRCGAALASRAELDYVSTILDHPTWLSLCPDCR